MVIAELRIRMHDSRSRRLRVGPVLRRLAAELHDSDAARSPIMEHPSLSPGSRVGETEYSVLATLWEREAEEPTQVLGDSPIFAENEPCKAAGRLVTGSTVSWDGGPR